MPFHYSIVHSIKGGCGKTSFSLALTLRLNRELAKKAFSQPLLHCLLLLSKNMKASGNF
jgi:MinD superfamily P-loop ATPase